MFYSFDQDVIVAGAGPAGSMAAIHLAQQGCRVLVLEKKAFPRHQTLRRMPLQKS